MMVLQRRLASSTFALWRSLIRREEKLRATLRELREGRLSLEGLKNAQAELRGIDIRDTKTGDEEEIIDGQEEAEQADESLAEATTSRSIADLEDEIYHVQRPYRVGKGGLRPES